MIRKAFLALADLFLPRRCVVCGRKLLLNERFCCTPCRADLPYTYFWTSPHNSMADRYNAKITDEPGYAGAVALFFYDSGSGYEHITQHLKYEGGIRSGKYFAGILADKMIEGGAAAGIDAVIPVPLHRRRLRSRGYNQAEVVAAVLAERFGARLYPDALKRRRFTRTQTGISVEMKAKNVEGAFELSKPLDAKHILIVDDVFTTGSTLAECQKAIRLKIGHGCKISIATLACVGE